MVYGRSLSRYFCVSSTQILPSQSIKDGFLPRCLAGQLFTIYRRAFTSPAFSRIRCIHFEKFGVYVQLLMVFGSLLACRACKIHLADCLIVRAALSETAAHFATSQPGYTDKALVSIVGLFFSMNDVLWRFPL